MRETPVVSVVMGVYNGARNLSETLASVLEQEGVNYEVVAVDDGSTDDSPLILEEMARRDPRLRVLRQANRGLTQALVMGCAQARGHYLARHDVGDTCSAKKLKNQLAAFSANPTASMVSCGTRFVGPQGEVLYDSVIDLEGATEALLTLDLMKLHGPSSHPSVLFPRRMYEEVGGYRAEFYYGQDLDLWVRLAERGPHIVLSEILYETVFDESAISMNYRKQQQALRAIIVECARLRRSGMDEYPALEKARRVRRRSKPGAADRARANYFIGSCLRMRRDPKAARYFSAAVHAFPFHLKTILRLIEARCVNRFRHSG